MTSGFLQFLRRYKDFEAEHRDHDYERATSEFR